jgi:hypothetical protein
MQVFWSDKVELGYKGNCGQFYCRSHSIGKLCGECGRREAIDWSYQDYLETARRIKKLEVLHHPRNRMLSQTLLEIQNTKPGFVDFYIQYEKSEANAETERAKEEFWELLGGLVGGVVAGTVEGTSEALKHIVSDNIPPDYHVVTAIRDHLEKKL